MKKKIIHLVDDESIIHDIFKRIFRNPNTSCASPKTSPRPRPTTPRDVDVVIMDQMIPGSSGLEIFKELKKDDPQIKVIFLTAFGTIEAAIEAIQQGAVDYLQKPFNNIELKHKVDRVIKEKKLNRENTQLKKTLNDRFSFDNIIGRSPLLKKILGIVESVADANSTVLITGESGTGKELIAKAIHSNSNRKHMPFSPRSIRATSRPPCSKACSSATRKAPTPGPSATKRASSRKRTAAPSFSTRSPT